MKKILAFIFFFNHLSSFASPYSSKLINHFLRFHTDSIGNNLKTTNLKSVDVVYDKPVSAASSKFLSQIDFENRPKNSAQDMLRLVPGLFIAQHAGGGKAEQIFIRGFDCDHGTDVATFVDGMPVNMPSHGHGQGYEDLHFLIPETVRGMEIFKGPYSPRFGDFATGAAVKFNTLDSLDHNTLQLESTLVPLRKKITASRYLALIQLPTIGSNIKSYIATDILSNRGYFESPQDFKRFNLFSKTIFAINDHSNLSLSLSGFQSSWNASGQIPERAVNSGMISRFGSIDDSEGGNTQRNNFNLVYHTQVAKSEFEAQAYLVDYTFKLFSNFTFYLKDPVNGDEIEQDDNRTVKGFNAHYTFSHRLGKMNDHFTIGISYRSDNIENQLWHDVKRNRLEVKTHSLIRESSTGIFINEVFRFSDKFRIDAGLRYDYFNFDVADQIPSDTSRLNYSGNNFQNLFSPKLNFIYTISERTQFFINSGIGYHSNDARSVVQQPNEHTLPIAVGAEIGTLKHFQNNITTSIAFWWMDMKNELVYVGDDGTTENRGPSRRTGIDASIRMNICPWLFADADINFSKNIFLNKIFGEKLTEAPYITLAPTFTSTGGLNAKFKNGIDAGIRYRYMGVRAANEFNTIKTSAYNIIDVTADYKIKKFKIGIVIENFFNTNWNEAQFDTESRLYNESHTVEELHFTPGTPFSGKLTFGYLF